MAQACRRRGPSTSGRRPRRAAENPQPRLPSSTAGDGPEGVVGVSRTTTCASSGTSSAPASSSRPPTSSRTARPGVRVAPPLPAAQCADDERAVLPAVVHRRPAQPPGSPAGGLHQQDVPAEGGVQGRPQDCHHDRIDDLCAWPRRRGARHPSPVPLRVPRPVIAPSGGSRGGRLLVLGRRARDDEQGRGRVVGDVAGHAAEQDAAQAPIAARAGDEEVDAVRGLRERGAREARHRAHPHGDGGVELSDRVVQVAVEPPLQVVDVPRGRRGVGCGQPEVRRGLVDADDLEPSVHPHRQVVCGTQGHPRLEAPVEAHAHRGEPRALPPRGHHRDGA